MIPHADTHVTRSGDRDIPDFDESLLDESIVSPGGNFRIHFTRSGSHAVSGSGVSGTPQYVLEAALAADSAYKVIVDELGFLPPLPDDGIDGIELDIYIRNYGGSFYGMTYFEDYTPSPAYLVVDNNYTEDSYATSGLDALRVTIAHEFFHMVQVRYAHPRIPINSNPYWYEISSTWMEEKCYPEVDDYHAYVADNFGQSSFPNLDDDRYGFAFSYGHGLFGQILDIEYGKSNGKHIMLDIWQSLSDREATDNLDIVLNSSPWQSSLTQAIGKYALYNVFTGSRAISNSYYPDAVELPEVSLIQYDLPEFFPDTIGVNLQPFEIAFKKFNIATYSDFFVRSDGMGDEQIAYLTYHGYEDGSSFKSAIDDFWIACNNVSSQDYLILPMVNGDRTYGSSFTLQFEGSALPLEDTIQTLWPNPSLPRVAQPSLNYMISEPGYVQLSIYNLLGQTIYHEKRYRTEGIKLVKLPIPASSPAGIYFVQLVTKDTKMSRKFTILR